MEEAPVQVLEDRLQIVVATLRRKQNFSSPFLAQEVSLSRNIFPSQISAIATCVARIDLFSVELCQKDVSDSVEHIFGCTGQKIGESDEDFALAEADRVVDVGKSEELYLKHRDGRTWTQFAICPVKDFRQLRDHLLRI